MIDGNSPLLNILLICFRTVINTLSFAPLLTGSTTTAMDIHSATLEIMLYLPRRVIGMIKIRDYGKNRKTLELFNKVALCNALLKSTIPLAYFITLD